MELAWLIPVLSFAAAPLIVIFGKYLPFKGSFLAILAIAGGFGLFWWVFISFLGASPETAGCFNSEHTGTLACNFQRVWFNAGLPTLEDSVTLFWGITIDPLSVAMLGMVTFVALMVQIYSLGYMHGDPRFWWYYAVHALFAAAMLTLVLADNFLLLFVAWELVGACSYLLVGFWFERREAREAAKKAFIVTRLGDVGLLCGILLLWVNVGSFGISETFAAIESGVIGPGLATVSALLLFLGAMGKSAQVPFHVWLPDAMEGPTPVSALIHAATMVAAGVYLVARAFPLFSAYGGEALMVVSIVGLVTALMAASIALVSVDLKRILAYSTISHLGLMMLSLGAFGYTAAIFHLLAHGFSKALLFLGAGSVMHSTNELDIRKMGRLKQVMPITATVFTIGALSLGGIFPFAGFWSKDEMLIAVGEHQGMVFLGLTLFTVFLSALYMARAAFVPFYSGSLRHEHHHVHDAPPTMALPMILLAFLAAAFGLLAINWAGNYIGIGGFIFFHEPEAFHVVWWLAIVSTALAVVAFLLAYLVYVKRSLSIEGLKTALAPLLHVAERKYYFDEVYQWIVDRVVLTFSALVAWFDRAIVNDVGINWPGKATRFIGVTMRLHVTGHVYSYALGMTLGAVALALAWWLISAQ